MCEDRKYKDKWIIVSANVHAWEWKLCWKDGNIFLLRNAEEALRFKRQNNVSVMRDLDDDDYVGDTGWEERIYVEGDNVITAKIILGDGSVEFTEY